MDNLGDADPMLGLFDTDNFLDELTGPSVSSSMSTGMGMGDPGVGGLQAGPFNQTPMQQPTQKLHHYDDFHSMNASNPFGTPGPTMNVAQNQQGSMLNSSPQQQQFNNQGHMQSPPAASSGFPQYSIHNNSHMNQTPQLVQSQAQMGMNRQMGQMNQWNQGAQGVQNQAYAGQQQGTQYLSHHDYALPKSNNQGQGSQRLSHFPEQQNQANFNASAPPMGSPPSTNRLTHMPMANTEPHVAMNGPAHSMPGQGHAGYQAPPQGNMMVPGQTQPLRHPQLNSGQPISGGQVNASQLSASAKLQHFNYQQQQQQQLQQQGNPNMMSQQNVNEAPPLTHMPPFSL